MKDQSLSPFLDQPSRLDIAQTSTRDRLGRLEYELQTLKTEKKLVENGRDATVSKYERLLEAKNDELARLQHNFDWVYAQKLELEKKRESAKSTPRRTDAKDVSEAKLLRAELKETRAKYALVEKKYGALQDKYEHLRADLNSELAAHDQYVSRIGQLQRDVQTLTASNKRLLEQQQQQASSTISGAETLKLRVSTLQKTNTELQARVDQCLQQKTGNELLKHKNASLLSQIHALEGYREKCTRVERMYSALQAKFNEYIGVIAASIEPLSSGENAENADESTSVRDFVQSFKLLQKRHLVTYDKLNEAQARVVALEDQLAAANNRIEHELTPEINLLKEQALEKNTRIASLSRTAVLNQKEIEFLRNSLKELDRLSAANNKQTSVNSASAGSGSGSGSDLYLSNLEKLVDEYKLEIDGLRKMLSASNATTIEAPTKRPRLVEDSESRVHTLSAMRKENIELLTEILTLKDQIFNLRKQLESVEDKSDTSNNPSPILELRRNPFANDQFIKQQTLDVLRNENSDLIKKYVENGSVNEVPRAVYARQEHDKDALQEKLDLQIKKLNRLKSVYSERSKDIIALISRYFGYSIEFIPNPINPNDFCSKIKLVSKYMPQDDANGGNAPYLILDVKKRSMKAHGNYEFKTLCEELVQQWVTDKYQIPCFLSALNLQIYSQISS